MRNKVRCYFYSYIVSNIFPPPKRPIHPKSTSISKCSKEGEENVLLSYVWVISKFLITSSFRDVAVVVVKDVDINGAVDVVENIYAVILIRSAI